ncbi:MAG: PsbP-related protein [Cyanobacteria bacterium P01_F01_bin.53]
MSDRRSLTQEEQFFLEELRKYLCQEPVLQGVVEELVKDKSRVNSAEIQKTLEQLMRSSPTFNTSVSESQLEKLITFGAVNQVVLEVGSNNSKDDCSKKQSSYSRLDKKVKLGVLALVACTALSSFCIYASRNKNILYLHFPQQFSSKETFSCYEGATHSISIQYPKNWSYQDINNPMTYEVALLASSREEYFAEQDVKLIISCEKLNEIISLKEFTNTFIKQIEASPSFRSIEFIEKRNISVANRSAQKIIYQTYYKGQPVQIMEVIMLKSGQAFVITYVAHDLQYLRYEKVINRMLLSLELSPNQSQ